MAIGNPGFLKTTPSFSGPRRQRGAIGLFAILVMLLAVLFTALALDTGRLAMEKRRLQKIADLAALDASRSLCSAKDVYAEAQASAVRNGYTGNLVTEGGVRLGTTTTEGGVRVFAATAAASADTVEVTARNTVLRSLVAGGLLGGSVSLSATGTAKSGDENIAGISAGSFLLRVDTSESGLNSLLGGILGTTVNLDLISYQGIAAANLSLLNLIQTRGGIGTVEELLDLNLSMVEWIELMATALTNKGDPASIAAAAYLNQLALLVVRNPNLRLGDLLKVTTDDPQSAANAEVNALDLLTLGAEVANGSHAVTLSTDISIPGVTSITLNGWIIEPPQIAIGPAGKDSGGAWRTNVKTAQIRLGVTLKLVADPDTNLVNNLLDALTDLLRLLTLGIISITLDIKLVDLSLALDVAPTTAWLESITCPSPAHPQGVAVVGSQTGLAHLTIGKLDSNGNIIGPADVVNVKIKATVKLLILTLTLLDTPLTTIGVTAEAPIIGNGHTTEFGGPFPQTQTVGTDLSDALSNALSALANSLTNPGSFVVTVGELDLSYLTAIITNVLIPVLQPILTALGSILTPLLQALGVNLGGADISVFTIKFLPDTGKPELVR